MVDNVLNKIYLKCKFTLLKIYEIKIFFLTELTNYFFNKNYVIIYQ